MNINISMHSHDPIYEQIKHQIKRKIQNNEIKPETQMPSVRLLAKELKVGIVTVKRAYDDLVQDGYLIAKTAVGYFSLKVDSTQILKEGKKEVESLLQRISCVMAETGLTKEEVIEMFNIMEAEKNE